MTASLAERRDRRQLEALHYELRWRQASSDFERFARECMVIERKDTPTGYGPFILDPHQKEFLRQLRISDAVMNLKARQLGISTLTLSVMLFRAVTTPGFKGLVLNHTDDYAKAAIQRLRSMFLMMPEWVRERLPVPNDAAGNFILDFGGGRKSIITAAPITKKVGASVTLDMVLFDEAALAEYAQEAYNTLKPTLDAIRKSKTGWAALVIVSTARGSTNWFAGMWKRGVGIAKVFFPWHASPIYTQADYDADLASATATGELREFYQERPASADEAFRMTGTGRFSGVPEPLKLPDFELEGCVVHDDDGKPAFRQQDGGRLHLDELPVPGRKYVLAVDPAHGVGRDYTIGTIWCYRDNGVADIVGYWRANDIEQMPAAVELMAVGELFAHRGKPALLAVEAIQGGTMLTVMRQARYKNLYRYSSTTAVAKNLRYEHGFPTNKATKPRIIDLLADNLPAMTGIWPEFARELHSFVVKDNGSMGADTRHDHDDIVMAAAIGLWVLTYGMNSSVPPEHMGENSLPAGPAKSVVDEIFTEVTRDAARDRREGRRTWRRQRRGW